MIEFVSGRLSRREFLKRSSLLAGVPALLGASCGGEKPAARPPNILLIVIDELGYYELSSMGNPFLETPNIDRASSEGMRFTQLLAGAPVCAPTRCTLMTGKHLGHASVRENPGERAIVEGEVTVASVLKNAGYATGGFGKWGLGGRGTTGVPEKHGFDTFFGYYDQVHAHTFFPAYLIRNSEEVPLPGNTGALYEGETFSHSVIFEEAVDFIRKNQDKPFFCYCPWTPPHGAWGLPPDEPSYLKYKDLKWDAKGHYREDDPQRYAAMVNMVDRQIGQLLDLLKELGLDENTIVLISGDNGGHFYFANEKYPYGFFGPNVDPRTGTIFRGKKGLLYEGGLRIPFIVRWPGKVQPGTQSDYLGYFPDVFPTLAEAAGAAVPPDLDGISFLPTLLGEDAKQSKHEYLYWEYNGQVAVRWQDWKAYKAAEGEWELYDLAEDIQEQQDLASKQSDILEKLKGFAEAAHRPLVRGEVLDPELCEKDHRFAKNPKPDEKGLGNR